MIGLVLTTRIGQYIAIFQPERYRVAGKNIATMVPVGRLKGTARRLLLAGAFPLKLCGNPKTDANGEAYRRSFD